MLGIATATANPTEAQTTTVAPTAEAIVIKQFKRPNALFDGELVYQHVDQLPKSTIKYPTLTPEHVNWMAKTFLNAADARRTQSTGIIVLDALQQAIKDEKNGTFVVEYPATEHSFAVSLAFEKPVKQTTLTITLYAKTADLPCIAQNYVESLVAAPKASLLKRTLKFVAGVTGISALVVLGLGFKKMLDIKKESDAIPAPLPPAQQKTPKPQAPPPGSSGAPARGGSAPDAHAAPEADEDDSVDKPHKLVLYQQPKATARASQGGIYLYDRDSRRQAKQGGILNMFALGLKTVRDTAVQSFELALNESFAGQTLLESLSDNTGFITSDGTFNAQQDPNIRNALSNDNPELLVAELNRMSNFILWAKQNTRTLHIRFGISERDLLNILNTIESDFRRFVGLEDELFNIYLNPRPLTLLKLCLRDGGPRVLETAFGICKQYGKSVNVLTKLHRETRKMWTFLSNNFDHRTGGQNQKHITDMISVFLLGISMCKDQLKCDNYNVSFTHSRDTISLTLDADTEEDLSALLKTQVPKMNNRKFVIDIIERMISAIAQKIASDEVLSLNNWVTNLNALMKQDFEKTLKDSI